MSRCGVNARWRWPPCALAASWQRNAWTIRRSPTICAVPRTGRPFALAAGWEPLQGVNGRWRRVGDRRHGLPKSLARATEIDRFERPATARAAQRGIAQSGHARMNRAVYKGPLWAKTRTTHTEQI